MSTLSGETAKPMSREPVLEIDALDIVYETDGGPLNAVRDVTLAIQRNESFGLVGESGSGKSTLAMGAIQYLAGNGRVAAGSVRLLGQELTGLSRAEMRHVWGSQVGVVHQSPLSALNPSTRIGKQLAEVARLHLGMNRIEARERSLEMLSRVAMPDPENILVRYPHQVSGGMLQRCVIAMALMTNPALLIMDEPTTALDVTTQAVVLDLVRQLKNEFDSAILYITHDLGVVARICDRVGVMYAGELLEQAAIREVFSAPRHPYTLSLLDCIPRLEAPGARRLLRTIPGSIPGVDELPQGCIYSPRCVYTEEKCTSERPKLREVGARQLSACRRWDVLSLLRRQSATLLATGTSATRAGDEPVLDVEDVSKAFPADGGGLHIGRRDRRIVHALDSTSLHVPRGQTLGIVGESGSGKTTLARTVVGLEEATSGTIMLNGRVLARSIDKRPRSVLRDIQMVFQNPDASLTPHRTIGAAIGRPLKLLGGVRGDDLEQRTIELLKAVQLPPSYYYRKPGELSGGERQRVAIACAFAADPQLVLLDEPLSALDVSVQGALMNLLLTLQAERGASYLFISHDLSAVQHLSDLIAVVYLGHVMEWGWAARVLSAPFHPYTEALLSAVPIADPDAHQENIRLEGSIPTPTDVPSGCRFHPRCPRCLGAICRDQEPPWRGDEGDHLVYCHIPLPDLCRLQASAEAPTPSAMEV